MKFKANHLRLFISTALTAAPTPYLHAESYAGEKLKGTLCRVSETVMFSTDAQSMTLVQTEDWYRTWKATSPT